MKTKLLFISLIIFFVTQMQAQLVVGNTFSDGDLSYKVDNVSPLEVIVTGFSGATVPNLIIPSIATYGADTYAVVGVGPNAFQAKGVVTVEFPDTLRSIGDLAFQGNGTTLISFDLTNPSELTSMGRAIFAGCSKLQSADLSFISVNFTSANDSMFNNCTSLTTFIMQNNTVTTMIPPVFLGTCTAMTTADFSGCTSITSFGDNVFRNDTALTTLYLGTDTPPTTTSGTNGTFAIMTGSNRVLKVPTPTGVTNYNAIAAWTSVFGTIQSIQIPPPVQVTTQRPIIWVKASEKQGILDDINNNAWKKTYYTSFTNRVNTEVNSYKANRQLYLSKLPFNNTNAVAGKIPPFKTVVDADTNAAADRVTYKINLQSAVDSGVLYYLTGNEDYAKYSASIFYTYMKAMNQVPLSTSTNFNASWIYPLDHLREARDFGAQIPIIYDFIATYINNGGTAYDFAANSEVTIDRLEAETVFKNYIFLAKNRGGLNTNWPILESPSLVGNILALDSASERATELPYYINKNTTRQASLDMVSKTYANNGGTWPEPFTYSRYVGEYSTYLMAVVTKYDPSFNLVGKYSNIPLSLDIPNDFVYPNKNRVIQFGDTSRSFAKYYDGYETAYYLGKLTNNAVLIDKFGKLINTSVTFDGYNRSYLSAARSTAVEPYFDEPLRLLWHSATVNGASEIVKQNVTNSLLFAGVSFQRNIETPDPLINGLMLSVGGAGFVHSYASGMNMELYGPRTAIGAPAGNTKNYTSDIHVNYYRLFAAHNTVIVNGSSQGLGGNVNIDINRVVKLAIEPEYEQIPVSLKNSFSTTSFKDDKGTLAEALQYRTLAIVRTSPTTGYYVDVFKSKSSLANEYHDYVYHNLADNLVVQNNNIDIPLTDAANRYPVTNTNGGFKNPGWHFFTNIKTSGVYAQDVNATFTATRLGGSVNMKMFVPGEANREYTRVDAPPTLGLSSSYDSTPTPTVLIRKTGEAWDTPFSVIYEPYYGATASSVKTVQNIKRAGIFAGMQVESLVNGKTIKQIILIRDNDDGVFNDVALNVKFTGRFAVLSMDENDQLTSIYMGKGSYINYKGWDVKSSNNQATSFYVDINGINAEITTNDALLYSAPVTISSTSLNLINNGTLSVDSFEYNKSKGSFILYPNPIRTSTILNLQTINLEISNASYKIISMDGKMILSEKIVSSDTIIDVSKLSNGIYMVQMSNDNAVVGSKKIIISNK